MMTRFLYILFLVFFLVACSGNNPIRYINPVDSKPYRSFVIEREMMSHDSFPLHYTAQPEVVNDSQDYSYSVIRNDGDTIVWEEGMIRIP